MQGKKNKFLFILFFLSTGCNLFFSQIITGTIKDVDSKENLSANIIIKNAEKPKEISEFVIAKNGSFSITLSKVYSKIIVEANVRGYDIEKQIIENPQKDKTYTINFEPAKEQIQDIKEVVITSNKKAFVIKEDTVKYNVSAYKDGTERKIEDIIKKLPGIEVNETSGEIKYKGKSVETVQLEGDDLFGSNYSLGTKNINVDLVEQVQAIENYSANPLLKGIEEDDKVALNLKLKKEKMDFSGNADYGSGFSDDKKQVFDLSSNVLGISKNFKSFGTLSYNNVGINESPFDYFGFNQNVEQISENDITSKKVIPESLFSSVLDDKRVNLNNQIFGNYNSILKIGKKIKIKTNLYYNHDKISQLQTMQNDIFSDNANFRTSDFYTTQKKPVLYRGDLELKINTSAKSLLEYKLKISQENISTISSVLQNDNIFYNTKLLSKSLLVSQNLLFTKKLNDKKVLQIMLFQSRNDTPQTYSAEPGIKTDSAASFTTQYSRFNKNIVGIKATLLGTLKKNKYVISIGADDTKTPFESDISGQNSVYSSLFENNLDYTKNIIYLSGAYHLNIDNLKISPSFNASLLEQKIQNPELSQKGIVFEPELALRYKINEASSVLASVNYNQKPFSENFYFPNTVFTDTRNSVKNIPTLELQKVIAYKFYYIINNLHKQFQLNLSINYSKSNGGYFPNLKISEDSTSTEYVYLQHPNDRTDFDFMINKYIPLLEVGFKFSTNYSLSNYQNMLNNSALRNNKSQYIQNSFSFKTAFDIKINFENTIRFAKNISQSESENKFENNFINNNFNIIFKPAKKWFCLLSSNYYIPNTDKKQNYHFLDFTLRYIPDKIVEFSLFAKNILNKKYFTQIETSDYSSSVFQSNLIPRYYLLNATYNF